jgi:hypothetical protein
MNTGIASSIFSARPGLWTQHREASLNWLALGLLLAAWNAADDGRTGAIARPQALRSYACVSVRAARHARPPAACRTSE